MVKKKSIYAYKSNTANTVHFVCILQIQNRVGEVEWI